MLVLSRKEETEIVIGESIVVRVMSIKGNRVTLGVSAPQNVSVCRGEKALTYKRDDVTDRWEQELQE